MATTTTGTTTAQLSDDLTGAVPTWRLEEAPIYDQLVTDWPAIYARLCQPITGPKTIDAVTGVVLDGPPTVPLALVPTMALDLDATQPLDVLRDYDTQDDDRVETQTAATA